MEVGLGVTRHLAVEDARKLIASLSLQQFALGLFLLDEAVYYIAVHTCKGALLQFTLQHTHQWSVQLSVHQQDAVAFLLGSLDVSVLGIWVIGIQIYKLAVLIGLVVLNEGLVFIQREVFAFCILQQEESLSLFVEVLF